MAMPKGDQYDAMAKAWWMELSLPRMNFSVGRWLRWRSIARYFLMSATYQCMFITMNNEKWKSLPPDIQKVFTEVSNEWVEYTGKEWNRMEIEGYQHGKKVGHTFIYLTPQEQARWRNAVKPLQENYIKAMQAKGLPGKEALEYRQQLIEKYGKMYPPLKFE